MNSPHEPRFYAPKATQKPIMENLSIDCVLFGLNKGELEVLVVKHGEGISMGGWALPGGWVITDEDLDAAAHRLLFELTGLEMSTSSSSRHSVVSIASPITGWLQLLITHWSNPRTIK